MLGRELIEIPVSARYLSDLKFVPSSLYVGTLTPGDRFEQMFFLRKTGTASVSIESISIAKAPCAKLTARVIGASGDQIQLTGVAEDVPGPFRIPISITVQKSDGVKEKIILHCSGMIYDSERSE